MFGEKVPLGQANGPDVELIVRGSELYATYETPEGYPAVYDDALGLFCYARIVGGAFESTRVPVTSAPPSGLDRNATESNAVQTQKIEARMQEMERRSQGVSRKEE